MKIIFYDAKQYDIDSFEKQRKNYPDIESVYLEADLTEDTARLAEGCEGVCAFVSSTITGSVLRRLHEHGVKLLLMRCAGYNNVDIKAADKYGITVLRVPGYSPEAVAEHAVGMMMSLNRRIHRAYQRTRDANFSLEGLTGFTMYGKTAGVIGTGKIGVAALRILKGFGMRLLAFDPYPSAAALDLGVEYVDLPTLFAESDVISLHCPLTADNYHLLNASAFEKMKDGVILINNARGQLIVEQDVADALNSGKMGAAGLDVVYTEPIKADNPLLQAKNCIITPHISWAPKESRQRIMDITVDNVKAFLNGAPQSVVNK